MPNPIVGNSTFFYFTLFVAVNKRFMRFVLLILALVVTDWSFGQSSEFRIIENRRIVDKSVTVWPYDEDESRHSIGRQRPL